MRSVLKAAVLGALAVSTAGAQAIRSTAGFTLNTLARNDDGSTGLVNLGFSIDFFGLSRTQAYVNNNGNITFTQALAQYTPDPIVSNGLAIIAPFWADVDTRGAGSAEVRYGTGTAGGRNVFAVNWIGVGYYDSRFDKLNSFQLWLVDRGDTGAGNFDFEFNYDRVQWDTGDASNGVNGLCGPTSPGPARAGWANGLAGANARTFELAGSGVCNAFLDTGPAGTRLIGNSLGSEVRGRYVFAVRNGVVQPPAPPPGVVPEPSTYALMATGLVGTLLMRRRRRD
jgi:hypothetical protein